MELGFLGPLFGRQGPWASVYFDTTTASEGAAARQRLTARSACDDLKSQGADADTRRAVYDTLVSLPRGPARPGHAVFATHGDVVLVTQLTVPPPGGGRPLATWQPLPHTGPLLELADSDPSCLVAYIDRKGAEFELRDPLGAHSAGSVTGSDWPISRIATGDMSERHFQTAVENTWEQNAAETAGELRARWSSSGAEVVVLAGDARERNSVYDQLPPDLRDRTVRAKHGVRADSGPDGPAANTAKGRELLDEEISQARAAYTQTRTAEALERFQAGRVPAVGGRLDAVEGVPALVEAAREHRIGVLLVRPDGADLHREIWAGDLPDQLAVRRSQSQYLGATEPTQARADDALLRSAAATGADVLCVHPSDVPEGVPAWLPDGGLGALLRWPYEGAPEGGGAGGGQHATR
jgi:hypothetical protein